MSRRKEGSEIGLNFGGRQNLVDTHLIPTASCLRFGIAVWAANLLCLGLEKRRLRQAIGLKRKSGLTNHKIRLATGSRYRDKTILTRGHICFRHLGPRSASVRH